jgi:4-aminobutyrate aminotransferase
MAVNSVGTKAEALISRDESINSSSYTREYPLVVDRAEGSLLWDVDGKRYIDFMSGIGVMNVGHRHPRVVEAVKDQLDRFWHICLGDFYYPQAVELSEQLAEIAPIQDPTRLYYGNSGAEAIEAAVKLAMYHTGRTKFIGFLGGFHGRTMGALSFTASKAVQSGKYPQALDVFHVPYPDPYRPKLVDNDVIGYIENLLDIKVAPDDVAAILVEAVQGEGGYIVPPSDFLPKLRDLCDRYGILLIVDEIQSGVGRTGKWWAIEHDGVEPDIIAFAKGIASGLPLSGIIARESVMTWEPGAQGSTFGGNPVAMAAALATLDVIKDENLLEQAHKSGEWLKTGLRKLQEQHPYIGDVRGLGMMVGIDIVSDPIKKTPDPVLRDELIRVAFHEGLLTLPCGESTLRFIAPLNTPQDLLEEGMAMFTRSLNRATELGQSAAS